MINIVWFLLYVATFLLSAYVLHKMYPASDTAPVIALGFVTLVMIVVEIVRHRDKNK